MEVCIVASVDEKGGEGSNVGVHVITLCFCARVFSYSTHFFTYVSFFLYVFLYMCPVGQQECHALSQTQGLFPRTREISKMPRAAPYSPLSKTLAAF